MPRKSRPLRLQVKFSAPGLSRETVLLHLIDSIKRGDYNYRTIHTRMRVAIGWSNRASGDLKWGEFRAEMQKSSESSFGFDSAVRAYLESQLEEIQ